MFRNIVAKTRLAVGLISTSILLGSCGGYDFADYLQSKGCAVPIDQKSNRELCEQLIEGMLPYDNSFEAAPDPAMYRRRVAQAYRAILEYPLDLDSSGRILGIAPNAAPNSIYEHMRGTKDARVLLFNYALSMVQKVSYDASEMIPQAVAWMGVTPNLGGHLAIRPPFFDAIGISDRAGEVYRAGVILHETRHADGFWHIPCSGARTVVRGDWTCDEDMNGLYGFEAMYNQAAMRGGAKTGYLNQEEVGDIGGVVCITIKLSVNRLTPELENLFSPVKCFLDINYRWLLDHGAIPIDSKSLPPLRAPK